MVYRKEMCIYIPLCSHILQSILVHINWRNSRFVKVNIEAKCEFKELNGTFNIFNGLIVIFNKKEDVICKKEMCEILFFIEIHTSDFVICLKEFKKSTEIVHS